jgi:phenylacetate-CoA ligase
MQGWNFPADYYSNSLLALETALGRVPFFQAWRKHDPGPTHPVDARFAALPAFYKKDMRQHSPEEFLPSESNLRLALQKGDVTLVQTSGSTDDKVTNVWYQPWWDKSEEASWKLNSHLAKVASGDHREAILVNPRNVGILSDEMDLSLEKRRLARYLYLNEKSDTVAWTGEHMRRMLSEINAFQPEVLEANPSMLAKLCRYAASSGQKVFQPGVVTFTYEYPTRFHLRQIRSVFAVPFASSYGTTETGYVFLQCEHGIMHQNLEFCRVDFQAFKKEHGGPSKGRILVTPFQNPWNYILRFDVGDVVTLAAEKSCPCGNKGLILSSVDGRKTNLTLTVEGRLVTLGELDKSLSELDDIDEYQFCQVDKSTYELSLVSPNGERSQLAARAAEILHQLYGKQAKIGVVFKQAIDPEISGKYQLARSLAPIEIEEYLEPR